MRRPALVSLATLAVLALVAVACSDSDDSSSSSTAGDTAGPKIAMVSIGDSVASGEGIAYGYTYDYDSNDPGNSHWSGGTKDPTWQGQYQLCHDDDQAYPDVMAKALGADLTKFACSGASYLNGITAEQTYKSGSTTDDVRPAQFGDWSTKTDLNADYDKAAPDVVVLTFGADDVDFMDIVQYCSLGFNVGDAGDAAIAGSDDPSGAIDQAAQERMTAIKDAISSGDRSKIDDYPTSVCTESNPGETIEKLFWDPINSGEIAQHYKDIVTAIQERGNDPDYGNGKVPQIVFTTYHKPLPKGLDGDCWDVWPLSPAEQQYLQSLQDTLQKTLEDAVKDLDGVTVADISKTMDGHEWCTEDPWTYGLSIINYLLDTSSYAPFHPTPDGQQAIADVVQKTVDEVMAGD